MSSILSSLQTGVSGLNAQSDAIGHISNNLSNARTTGYKTVDTEFTNLVTNSNARTHDPGATKANPAYRNGVQGDISQSSQSTHMSISGNGFFSVKEAQQVTQNDVTFQDQKLYTRRGDFEVDRQGFLTNGADMYLQGKRVLDQDSRQTADQLQAVNISQGGLGLEPKKTSEVAYNANLPGKAEKAKASDFFTTDTKGRAQISEVTLGTSGRVEAGDTFSVTVNGSKFEYTAGGGESAGAVKSYFIEAINTGAVTGTPGKMSLPDDPTNFGTAGSNFPDVTAELVPGKPGSFRLTATTDEGNGTNRPGGDFTVKVDKTQDPLGAVAESKLTQGFAFNPEEDATASGDLSGTIESGDTFSITVDGRTATYTAAGSEANVDEIVGYLTDAVNGFTPAPSPPGNISGVGAIEGVTATQQGDQIKLEANEAGTPIGDVSIEVFENEDSEAETRGTDQDRRVSNQLQAPSQVGEVYSLTVGDTTVSARVESTSGTPTSQDAAQALADAAAATSANGYTTGTTTNATWSFNVPTGTSLEAQELPNDGVSAAGGQLTINDDPNLADATTEGNSFDARIKEPSGNVRFNNVNDNRRGEAVFASQNTVRESVSVGTAATKELDNLGSLGINEAIRVGDGFKTGEDFDSSEDFYTTKDKFLENTVSGGSTTMYGKDGTEYDIQFRWMYRGKDPISGEDQWQMYYKDPAFQNEGGVGVDASNGNGNTHWVPALGFEGATFKDGKLTSRATFEGNRSITFTQGDKKPLQVSSFSFNNPDGSKGLTNFADEKTSITRLEQNGYQAGSVTDIRVDDEGFVVSEFDNGEQRSLYEVTVSVFSDPNALRRTDGTAFKSTTQSGTPRLESEGRNGAGDIQGSTLESSTTEIAESFTEMIEAQRIYTANTRVITTADQMTQQTLQLKQ